MLGWPGVESITTGIVALGPVSGVAADAAVVIITTALGPVRGVAGDAALVAAVVVATDAAALVVVVVVATGAAALVVVVSVAVALVIVVGVAAARTAPAWKLVAARSIRFDYMERRSSLAIHLRRLPDLARRLEEILFTRYPNKIEYCNMMRGPIEPHLHFAVKLLIVRNRQLSREITCSPPYWTMTVTPGITQGAGENSRMSLVTGNMGPLSSGPDMVPMSANMGTFLPGEAPDEHVNTLLSLGMNPTHHDRPRACNNNLVIDTVDTPETNRLLKPRVRCTCEGCPKGTKFSCPVCMNERPSVATSSARTALRPPSRLRASARPAVGR